MRKWIVTLPPETLCNILSSLAQSQSRTKQEANQLQAQAIVQIMQCLRRIRVLVKKPTKDSGKKP